MSLTLHRVIVPNSEEESLDDEQLFIFAFEGASNLSKDVRNVESNDFNFGGNVWSLVCARKDDNNLGFFLKWKYSDSSTAKEISVRTKFVLTLIHQRKPRANISFISSSQKFSSSQTILGKSKMISLEEFLNPTSGFLDENGKLAMIEVHMIGCTVRYESIVDVSPKFRHRKNASGIYFDSSIFHLANQRWFLRFYLQKINSNNLPAVYLYLHDSTPTITTHYQFTLILGQDSTEILEYDFGEGAKFDGFGKTLSDQFPNPEKLTEISVACEITRQKVYKFVPVRIFSALGSRPYDKSVNFHRKSPLPFGKPSLAREKLSVNKLTTFDSSNQTFQDHYSNPWKVDLSKEILTNSSITFLFDKGIYHYPNNKSTIACIQAYLMSNNLNIAQDVPVTNGPVVGYFSNFSEDKGSLLNFALNPALLTDSKGGYLNEDNEVIIRIDFVSIQTTPISVRSGPKYDLYIKQLIELRQELEDKEKMPGSKLKEMSASKASLNMLENDNDRPPSGSSYSSGLGSANINKKDENFDKINSNESLNVSSNGIISPSFSNKRIIKDANNLDTTFLLEYLNNLATSEESNSSIKYRDRLTADNSIEKKNFLRHFEGIFDETTLIKTSRCNAATENKQKEIVAKLVSSIKKIFPLPIWEIVLLGSLGTQTTASSRSDVDIIIYSKDLPQVHYRRWLPTLLQSVNSVLRQHLSILPKETTDSLYSNFKVTDYSVQMTINSEIDVDIFLAFDWSINDETSISNNQSRNNRIDARVIKKIFLASTSDTDDYKVKCLDVSCSIFRKIFIDEIKPEIKDYVKVVKQWRNLVQWKEPSYRPDSYLILLLIIRAAELCEKNGPSLFEVLKMFGKLVLKEPELKISWNWFYNPLDYDSVKFQPPTPLIRDPVNPAINVANYLKYWGQFKTDLSIWLTNLKINIWN